MKVDRGAVEYIANLAYLELQPSEVDLFAGQLQKIIGYIDQLNEVQEKIEPFSFSHFIGSRLRPDAVAPSLPTGDVLRNAPDSAKAFFKVPQVIETRAQSSASSPKGSAGFKPETRSDKASVSMKSAPIDPLLTCTIDELLSAYRSKETTPLEVCEQLLARIDQLDPAIGAFLRIDRDAMRRAAEEASLDLSKPLAGVPIAIKDVISTRGIETTAGSKILSGYIPPYDATVIARLKEAGAILLGKTNCDEFAMGSSTENSAYQLTRNPWNLEYTPGGSSGGSAAAIASAFAFAALGSDTGGSIRQPAAMTGIIGLKPTYGSVSRYGLVAFGSSLDCIGPLARSVEDAALLFQVIRGFDMKDSTSANQSSISERQASLPAGNKLRVGIPREYFAEGLDPEVATSIQSALQWMESTQRVQLKPISLPHTKYAIASYYIVATAEASSNLSRFDGVRYGRRSRRQNSLREMYRSTREEGFGAEVKRRIMLGTFALSSGYYEAYYRKALVVRSLIARDFDEAFRDVDLICTPTSPTVAFRLGEKVDDPLAMYLSDIYTVTISLAGLPAISIPCGFNLAGLPIGLQMIGNYFDEQKIFDVASLYLKEHPLSLPNPGNSPAAL